MEHVPKITVQIISHNRQLYDTVGDYRQINNKWNLSISKMTDWRAEAAVIIHELVEMFLTKHHGVDWNKIDEFDMIGEGANSDDPGMLESAPYHNEHLDATVIEQMFCKMIGLDWTEYNRIVDNV